MARKLGLAGGRLPRGCAHIRREVDVLRLALETAVANAKGELSIVDASTINTVARYERLARMSGKWLVQAELDVDQRLQHARTVAWASEMRDRSMRLLGLERHTVGDLASIYRAEVLPPAAAQPPAAPVSSGVPQPPPGDVPAASGEQPADQPAGPPDIAPQT